jgi:uncharacterized protein YbbC (DUF1343 family)
MRLKKALKLAVELAGAPGAVGYVGHEDRVLFHGAQGLRQRVPKALPMQKDTLFDLASLTKVVGTATAVMLLVEDGKLDLDQPASEVVPIPAFHLFTPRHLMTHTAGLPAFKPWYREVKSVDAVLKRLAAIPPSWTPGSRRRYSDLGFMILGRMVELITGEGLDEVCGKRIFKPLGMEHTAFRPPKKWRGDCAATEKCAWRGRVMVGEVHDETAYAVGGVSGHAGLFSTAEDLARFCSALLAGKVLPKKRLEEMCKMGQVPNYPWQGQGWKMDPWMDGSEGFLPSRAAIGHTGWTGTSIWMDRRRDLFTILLTNTCHPSRKTKKSKTLRRVFHQAVADTYYKEGGNAHTGLDRLVWDGFDAVRGKKLGILTNQAAVDQLGRPLYDVFRLDASLKVKRLFSPEHGFKVHAEAGEKVASKSGAIPITSLYGKRKAPSAEELKEIDLLVIDLPDIGSRYYTYMATMKHCLHACAKTKTSVLVLDRPNPLGGVQLEGAIAQKVGSDVCCAAIPARHGMTLGELALFFLATELKESKLSLRVVPAGNWWRPQDHAQTALPWVPPSPNMPDAQTALLYAGMCLFEGVNLNEGRGTETPFRLIGAPWLDPAPILERLRRDETAGCELQAVHYVPRSIPGKASHPTYQDQECQGIALRVTDARPIRPFTLAVALLAAIRRYHSTELQFKPFFDTLAGGPWLREQIEAGKSAPWVEKQSQKSLAAFDAVRPRIYGDPESFWKTLAKTKQLPRR